MSIFSMVLRLCISHTHSIEAFIIWEVLRRLVVVPGIDVRLGCQVDVMAILAACDRTGSCSFQRDKSRNGAWFRSVGGPSMHQDRVHGKHRIDSRRQRHGNAMTSVAHR